MKTRSVKLGSCRPSCTSTADEKDRWPRSFGVRTGSLCVNVAHGAVESAETRCGLHGHWRHIRRIPINALRMASRNTTCLSNTCFIKNGRAVFIQSSIKSGFVVWLPDSAREGLPWHRKSLLRHPVELNRGTPLAFPMSPRDQLLAPRIWKRGGLKVRYESTRTFCECASMHNGCSSPI